MENITLDSPSITKKVYAGFWLRFVAFIIDAIILAIAQSFIVVPFLGLLGISMVPTDFDPENASVVFSAFMGAGLVIQIVSVVIGWMYFALMESGPKQGTLGKMALNIIVTDQNGERISFLKATGRHFAKIISAIILLIGYIMAAFTEKKQALHDIMADCLVLVRR